MGLPVTLPLEAISSVASRLRNLASSVTPELGSPKTGKIEVLAGDGVCELRISVLPAGDGEAA
jgi:type II secretory ATPase GspE/PulE/Tfp pilus assembly ATPase PilB-like protein